MKNQSMRYEDEQTREQDDVKEQLLRELMAVQEETKGVEAERCCGPRCHCGMCSM